MKSCQVNGGIVVGLESIRSCPSLILELPRLLWTLFRCNRGRGGQQRSLYTRDILRNRERHSQNMLIGYYFANPRYAPHNYEQQERTRCCTKGYYRGKAQLLCIMGLERVIPWKLV